MKIWSNFLLIAVISMMALTAQASVVINEIMYNTPGTPDVEWVELYNNGDTTVELDDWYMIDDNTLHPHCILMGDLLPGEYLVVVGDFSLFTPLYPDVTAINVNAFDPSGTGFSLGNGGDTILIYNDDGVFVDSVTYDDGGNWPQSPDGNGPSLELVNPFLDNTLYTAWDPSIVNGGTPAAINSTFQFNQTPIIHDTDRDPRLPQVGDDVLITALVSDATDLDRVELFVDLGTGFVSQPMYDDGAHGDGAAADSLFASTIPSMPDGSLIRYYVVAYDEFGQSVSKPSDAPLSSRAYTMGYSPIYSLRINEIMATNNTTLADEFGEFDDWVEILNTSNDPVELDGMYLTDNFGSHRQWMLPNMTLNGGEILIVWCDDQPTQGPLHSTFKLSGFGEDIALYDTEEHGNTLLSGFRFGMQNADVTFGYYLTFIGIPGKAVSEMTHYPEFLTTPTPGDANDQPSAPVVINEFLTTSNFGGVDDWIEFRNVTNAPVDISGWGVSDNSGLPLKWVFPVGTILDANSHIVVNELELGFSMSSSGEEIQLCRADGLTAIDYISFGQQQPDISFGRTDGSLWGFMDPPTPGEANPHFLSPVEDSNLPLALTVRGAYPNPFNPTTNIHFELARDARVTVEIFSIDGHRVRTIDGGVMTVGSASLTFNGVDNQGRRLASGVFFARINAGSESAIVKMMMVK